MKIAIYGAPGMVGRQITAEALSRGHHVTAISREGTPVEGATALAADLGDLLTFRDVAEAHDVVVISIPPSRSGGSHESLVAAHQSIAGAPVAARVFIVGGAGATEVDGVRLVDTPGFPEAAKGEATTMGEILDIYRAAAEVVDWTMLAPAPVIKPGERTGEYILGEDSPAGDEVSTQDFAVAVLDELEEPKHRRMRFTVAN